MGENDVQIGDTWTVPYHRGKGLAGFALQTLLGMFARPEVVVWYVVEAANLPSIRVAVNEGLVLAGYGRWVVPLRLTALGRYCLFKPVAIDSTQPSTA